MNNTTYHKVTGYVFLIIFVLHLWRVVQGWEVLVSGYSIPIWVSVLALLLAGFLAYNGLKGTEHSH